MARRHSPVARAKVWHGLAGAVLAVSGAQSACAGASPASAALIQIPAQPLERALMELARQSGSNILFTPGSMAGLMARPVRSRDLAEALRQMTAGLPVRVLRQHHGVAIAPGASPQARRATQHAFAATAAPPAAPVVILVTAQTTGAGIESTMRLAPETIVLAPDERASSRNLAEAFAHTPGMLVLSTNLQGDLGGIDRAGRAQGQFLAIRGLGGAYAGVRVDGVDLPQSLPYGRDAELGMLSTLLFDTVRVDLTPGPQQAGDATSALVDLVSPSAFSGARQGLRISGGSDLDSQAMAYRQPAASWQFGARYTHRFGDWGLALGATVSRRVFATSEQTYQDDTVELKQVTASGTTPAGVNPATNLLLTGLNLEFTRGATLNAAVDGALEWHGSHHWADIRLFYATSHTQQDVYQLGFQGGDTAADETVTALGAGVSAVSSTSAQVHYWYQTNPETSRLALIQGQWGGDAPLGAGTLDWQGRLFWTQGITARPRHIETSFWSAQTLSQGVAFGDVGGYPVPLLSAADTALANSAESFPVHLQAERRDEEGTDRHGGLTGQLRWRPDEGPLALVEAGAQIDLARRSWWQVDTTYDDLFPTGTTLDQTGLVSGQLAAILPGIYDFTLPLVSGSRLAALIDAATPEALTLDEANGSTLFGHSTGVAASLRAVIGRGALTLSPGLRFDTMAMRSTYWLAGNNGVPAGGIAYGWNHTDARFTALLPSLFVNWRPGTRWQMAAGLWTSTTRPAISQLSGSATLSTQSDGSLLLTQGNPALKAMRNTNLDLAGDWHGVSGATLHLAFFAKWLAHYTYDAGSDYANAATTSEDGITVSQPVNGGTARLLGAELAGSLPLGPLMAGLHDVTLGVAATALSGRVRLNNALLDPVEHMQNAPAYNLSADLAWKRGPWSARVTGRWTGAFLQQYGLFGLSQSGNSRLDGSAFDIWVRPSRQIDAEIGYRMGRRGTLRLFAQNVLADVSWRATMGLASDAVAQTITAGRQIGMKVDYAF